MLMVGTIAGVLLATVLNNGGGAWDNAKKYIESGHLLDAAGNVLGKKTPAHAAAVVGDTVGDPFKDTAGPSLARPGQAAGDDHARPRAAVHPVGGRERIGRRRPTMDITSFRRSSSGSSRG